MPYAPWNAGGYYPFSYGTGGVPTNTTSYGTNGQPSGGGSTGGQQYGSLPSYTVNPAPQQGNGAYGLVPGPTGIPPSLYQQSTTALPGLATGGTQATNNILSQLQGDISPQAQRNMQDLYARFAAGSGMPGSNAIPGTLANNAALLGNYRTTEQLQQQGLQNYNNLLSAVGQQQIKPETLADIAAHNANLAAAPNPQAAAEQQLANYFASLNAARSMGLRGQGGGGGYNPAGGTGVYASQQQPSGLGFGFGSLGQGQQPVQGGYGGSGSISGLGGTFGGYGSDAAQMDAFWNQGTNYPTPYQSPVNYGIGYDVPQSPSYGVGYDQSAWNDWGLAPTDYSGSDWTDYLNI